MKCFADAVYGAWGFGEQNLPLEEVGHVDLSHSRRVLEALQKVKFAPTHACWSKAKVFLERLQQEDGGFCSSTYTFSNPWGRPNKEDDPLLATALAVLALNAVINK